MNTGLSQHEIKLINNCFNQIPEIEKALLFGSRAMGTHRISSDVDITIDGKNLTLTHLFYLENLIDELLLPYKFDFVLFNTIDNAELLDHIKRRGIKLYP